MWINPTTPNLADYASFVGPNGVVGIKPVNLPSDFVGVGSVSQGSNILTIASVTSGALYAGAQIADASLSIPINTTIAQFLTGTGGIGTYQISGVAATNQASEAITAYNNQLVFTLQLAQQMVNQQLAQASANVYTLACYNFAADRLINFANDVTGQTFFNDLRGKLNISVPAVGIVATTFDQVTGTTLLNPDVMKNLTFQNLQMTKTEYGRNYLGFAQSVGTLWGMS